MSQNQKLSALPRVLPDGIENIFKESYVLDFLNLPENHNESDLQKGLVHQMKTFLLELGKDFLFMGEEYRLQVATKTSLSIYFSITAVYNAW